MKWVIGLFLALVIITGVLVGIYYRESKYKNLTQAQPTGLEQETLNTKGLLTVDEKTLNELFSEKEYSLKGRTEKVSDFKVVLSNELVKTNWGAGLDIKRDPIFYSDFKVENKTAKIIIYVDVNELNQGTKLERDKILTGLVINIFTDNLFLGQEEKREIQKKAANTAIVAYEE